MHTGTCIVKATKPYQITSKDLQFEEVVQPEWKFNWTKETVYYTNLSTDKDIGKKIRLAMNIAMTVWNKEIKLKLRSTNITMMADITIDFKDSSNDDLFSERPGVLAYAYFPGTSKQGIIVFNSSYIWSLNGNPIEAYKIDPQHYDKNDKTKFRTYNIIHTLIHEIGHSLGLRHDAHNDSRDVMDAYYNGMTKLSAWDKHRILLKYEGRIWTESRYERFTNWLRLRLSRL